MGNLPKKLAQRWPYGVLLLIFLTLLLSVDLNVGLLNRDASVAGGMIVSYEFDSAGLQNWFVGIASLGAMSVLVLLCFLLPALRPVYGFGVSLSAALVMVGIYYFNESAGQSVSLRHILLLVTIVYGASLCGRALMLWFRRRRVLGLLRQYIPPQLISHYMKNPDDIGVVGESRDMTIMFCDIKRFTAISERLDPELLPEWLNRYFDAVSEVIVAHGGTVDKYIGDSVMAFWGAPTPSASHAYDALRAAREILKVLDDLSAQLVAENLPPIAVGIGISTGNANVGHLGSRQRMTYTVVGDAVNTADRLQRCTGHYDLSIVVNDTATEKVPEFLFRELDTVHVKGRQRFVRIFQPVCHQDEALPKTHRQLQLHRKAMQFYRRGMWEDAEKLFRLLSSETNEIDFYKKYIERMVNIRKSAPGDGSEYIVDFTQRIG